LRGTQRFDRGGVDPQDYTAWNIRAQIPGGDAFIEQRLEFFEARHLVLDHFLPELRRARPNIALKDRRDLPLLLADNFEYRTQLFREWQIALCQNGIDTPGTSPLLRKDDRPENIFLRLELPVQCFLADAKLRSDLARRDLGIA